jgi:multiple sugar transport system substrate-binding protein
MTRQNAHKGLSKLVIIILFGVIILIILGVVLIVFGSKKQVSPKAVNLTMWGVWDDSSDLEGIVNAYHAAHPYITINYVKKRIEEYEDTLLKGWATDTGPDIFALPNSWITKYKADFLSPMPASTKIAFYSTKKILFKTDTVIEYATRASLTANNIKQNFITPVYNDVVLGGKIYGLPFGVSPLIMFYNRDVLNLAHYASPPATWSEFADAVTKIAVVDDRNNIIRAGAALGTSTNVPHATDILTLLMMQNGTPMLTNGRVTIDQPSPSDPTYSPAEQALRFYTDFAAPEKSVYTWNQDMPSAADSFAQGKLAFLFGYKNEEADILSRGTNINYGIAPVPQINTGQEINYANYYVYTVAKKTTHANEAWAFLQYAADAKRVGPYLTATKQTSAILSVLNGQLNDPDLGVIAQQALTSQTWYHGRNPQGMEAEFANMIQSVLDKTTDIKQIISIASKKILEGY